MGLWGHLLASPEGQMSLIVIAFMIGMGIWFAWYFNKKIRDSGAAEDEKKKQA